MIDVIVYAKGRFFDLNGDSTLKYSLKTLAATLGSQEPHTRTGIVPYQLPVSYLPKIYIFFVTYLIFLQLRHILSYTISHQGL